MAWLHVVLLSLLAGWVFSPASAFAGGRIVEQDSNNDGRTDRIAHLDSFGNIVKLEADTDGDRYMDTVQYYEKGVVVRLERDTDADGHIDEREILEKGKRTINQKLNASGEIVSVMNFDDQERPLKWQRDTTGDGRMDTVSQYEGGNLQLVMRDTTGGGRVNVWQHFKNDIPREQKSDLDGDGRIEQVVEYDAQGRPVASWHDLDEDGETETVRRYQNGEIYRQEQFLKDNGQPDVVTEFVGGQAVLEKRDTNGDGAIDVLVRMEQGKPASREEDIDHDGRMDRFTEFDDRGRPMIMREFEANPSEPARVSRYKGGKLFSVEHFDQGRVVLTRFQDEKPITQTIDEDKDGQPEQTLTYDKQGIIGSAVIDTSHDGRIDTWQHYEQGKLVRAEQDRDHDGEVDARLEYDNGKEVCSYLDNDGDGCFETVLRFDDPKWTKVMDITNGDGRLMERQAYSGEVLRKKEVFDAAAGRPFLVEEYDKNGKIVLSRETENGAAALNLTWRYDAGENAVMAEKDTDGDGRIDIWYHYENGRVTKVEEDRNRDGRPDLWETYDAAQVVVYRGEDLDFDGTADIEKRF